MTEDFIKISEKDLTVKDFEQFRSLGGVHQTVTAGGLRISLL